MWTFKEGQWVYWNGTIEADRFKGVNAEIDNINLEYTTFANQKGIIYKNGNRFIHDFNYGNNGTVTTEGNNTFVGVEAGNLTAGATSTNIASASHNTAVGNESLNKIDDGSYNTAVGAGALWANYDGNYNTALGQEALVNNTRGNYNTAVGAGALWANTTGGSNNIAIGYNAGRYHKNGNNLNYQDTSIFIGNNTRSGGNFSDDDNEIVIGHNAIGNGSNTVTIGSSAITNTYLRGNVNFNGGKMSGSLYCSGAIYLGHGVSAASGAYLSIGTGTGKIGALDITFPTRVCIDCGGQSMEFLNCPEWYFPNVDPQIELWSSTYHFLEINNGGSGGTSGLKLTNQGGSNVILKSGSLANSSGAFTIFPASGTLTCSGALEAKSNINVTGTRVSMTDTLRLGMASEVNGTLLDYGSNFSQLGGNIASAAGGFFRIDLRDSKAMEFFNIKFVPASNAETTPFKMSRIGDIFASNSLTTAGNINISGAGIYKIDGTDGFTGTIAAASSAICSGGIIIGWE